MAIASNLSNILKVLLMVMRWRMASSCSKLHKNHFLIIPSNMQSTLYPQIYRGLISIDRFFPFFLWLFSVFFFFICSALRRYSLGGLLTRLFASPKGRSRKPKKKQQFTRPIEHSFSCLHHILNHICQRLIYMKAQEEAAF